MLLGTTCGRVDGRVAMGVLQTSLPASYGTVAERKISAGDNTAQPSADDFVTPGVTAQVRRMRRALWADQRVSV